MNIKRFLHVFALLWTTLPLLEASEIPHYAMDSFALSSDTVVLCEEKKIDFVETDYAGGLKTVHNVIACRVTESFKGDLKVGADIKVTYDAVFARYRCDQHGYMDVSKNPPVLVEPTYVPAGKVVLFLAKTEDGGYSVVTAKLIQGDEILQFRQFSNPGPLVLTPQNPEKLQPDDAKSYGEESFLKDVRLSIEASRNLKESVPIRWGIDLVPTGAPDATSSPTTRKP